MLAQPWNEYVNMVAGANISNRGENVSEEEKNKRCIVVGFRKDPPPDLDFPDEWEGSRVFYEIIGELFAQ